MRQVPIRVTALIALAALSLAACAHTAIQTTNAAGAKEVTQEATPGPIEVVPTDGAPRLAGESQAVIAGGFLFTSGQVPREPKTGERVGGTIEQATERVLDNLGAVLRAAGLTLADVVKTTVVLTSDREFDGMDAVYCRRFGAHRPARSIVVVDGVLNDSLLEIDAIAKMKDAKEPPATNR